jgi:type IV pilus assembly protein PilY1
VPGARGLASPQLADTDLDYKMDYIAVGDLNGNVYRIDTTEENMGQVDLLYRGSPERPITTMPTIFQVPGTLNTTVVVGTGKYLEDSDREINIPRQAIVGLSECGFGCDKYPLTDSNLVVQEMTLQNNGNFTMEVTQVADEEHELGWMVQLGNPQAGNGDLVGERIVSNGIAIFDANMVVMTSYIPSHDPCAPSGTGAVYVLSAHTGGFVYPGDLGQEGYDPGEPVIGDDPRNVGKLFDSGRPMPQPFIGELGISGMRIRGLPVRRRSGWREIDL